jgi:hypothetical protein
MRYGFIYKILEKKQQNAIEWSGMLEVAATEEE